MTTLRATLCWVVLAALAIGCGGASRSLVTAREAEDRGDLDGAIRVYREQFDDGGRSDADLAARLGRLELRRGDLAAAGAHLQAALGLRPDDPEITLDLARVAFASGDYARAADLLQPVVERTPNQPACRAQLARVAFALNDFTSAIAHAEQALSDGATDRAELWLLQGRSQARVGRVDLAEEAFRKAIELAPEEAAGYYYLGRLCDEINLPKRAVGFFEQALNLSPAFIDASRDLGTALLHAGDAEQAVQVLENARALSPDDAGLLNNLGVAQRQAGQLAEARATFEAALVQSDGSRAIAVNLADTCLRSGDFARAQEVLVGATKRHLALRDDVLELEKILVLRSYHDVVCARRGAFDREAFRLRLAELRRDAGLDAAEQPSTIVPAVLEDVELKTLLDEANQRCLAEPTVPPTPH